VEDVLAVSKVDSGKIDFRPEKEQFHEFCQSIVENYQNNFAESKLIEFSYDLKETEIVFDRRFMESIYNNLLSNAIKYSPMGGVIKFRIYPEKESIISEVEDRGIGIPEADFPYLFEPFHRGLNVNRILGTGLGMSIIKNYVDLMDGKIYVESKINEGTKIKIVIPIISETATI